MKHSLGAFSIFLTAAAVACGDDEVTVTVNDAGPRTDGGLVTEGGAIDATVDAGSCATAGCDVNATCSQAAGAAPVCTCKPGFSTEGKTCKQINDCGGNPCLNGAACVDGTNSYTCTCLAGYSGKNCESNIDDCVSNTCLNGATCVDGVNTYTCTCVAGYSGPKCATNIDECASNPCVNGGTCADGINDYTCTCPAGYDGKTCSNNIDECASNPCVNGGTCADGINDYTCTCPAGYDGKTCSNDIDECASKPCVNGGTCSTPNFNDFTCTCPAGYDGKTCSNDIDECASKPCKNGGTCSTPAINDYSCACPSGFGGKNCTIPLVNGKAPLGYWPLEEGTGAAFGDLSGNALSGTLINATWVADGRVAGGQAVQFAGTGRGVVAFPKAAKDGSGIFIPQSNMTFSLWFKTSASTVQGLQLVEGSGCDRIVGSNSTNLIANFWNDVNFSGAGAVNDGTWHHMAYVLEKGVAATVYIDGAVYSSSTAASGGGIAMSQFDWALNYWFGSGGNCRYGANNFTGLMDDVSMWAFPMTLAEVGMLYNMQK